MKQDTAQDRTSVWSQAKPVEASLSVELCAGFTGDGTQMEQYAARLCQALISTGTPVQTIGGFRAQIAQRKLKCNGRCTTALSIQSLCEDTSALTRIVFADAFEFASIDLRGWHRRRMGELRACQVMWAALTGATQSILVLDPKKLVARHQLCAIVFWVLAICLRRPVSLRLMSEKAAPLAEQVAQTKTGEPKQTEADACVLDLAFSRSTGKASLRLTPSQAEHAVRLWSMQSQISDLDDFVDLIAAAGAIDLRLSAQVRMMRNCPSGAFDPSNRDLDETTEIAENTGVPITRYMLHLREALRMRSLFPLEKAHEAKRFLNWYVWEAARHVGGCWVPIAPKVRDYFLAAAWHSYDAPFDAIDQGEPFAMSTALAQFAQREKFRHLDPKLPAHRLALACAFIVEAPPELDLENVLGPQAITFLAKPLPGEGAVTRFELILALLTRLPFDFHSEQAPFWCSDALRRWTLLSVRQVLPAAKALLSDPPPTCDAPKSFLTGFAESATGIAENLAMSDNAFKLANIPASLLNADDALRMDHDVPGTLTINKSFGIHHINAERIPQTLLNPAIPAQSAYQIGFLLWEFQKLPAAHQLALDMLDEIWVPSTFVGDVYADRAPGKVHLMRKGIELPDVQATDLRKYKVNPGETTFLVCFDFHSSVARKNPLAAVRAFTDAFPKGRKDVRLIVKTTPATRGHWGDPERQLARIRSLAAKDKRITIIERFVSRDALIGLLKGVDCLVSTHRSEGFGLLPAYALCAGVPVIATDYSGTRDFCTQKTAGLLPYSLRAVEPDHMIFPVEGARWAETDHDATVAQMRSFHKGPSDLKARALIGQQQMSDLFSLEAQASRYKERLNALGLVGSE